MESTTYRENRIDNLPEKHLEHRFMVLLDLRTKKKEEKLLVKHVFTVE